MRRLLAIGGLLLLIAGCSEPPQKEINEAQAALDAARNAGAGRYASGEFTAAASSLDKAKAAVDQRDYRQALNYAIDSRQRASEAARLAGEEKAGAKRGVEALYGEAATRANRLQTAIRTAESNGVPARSLRPAQASLRDARVTLQKASAAISGENYDDAEKSLTAVRGKLDAALSEVEKIPPARAKAPARKRTR